MLHHKLFLADLARETALLVVRFLVLQQIVVSRETLLANVARVIFLPAV